MGVGAFATGLSQISSFFSYNCFYIQNKKRFDINITNIVFFLCPYDHLGR